MKKSKLITTVVFSAFITLSFSLFNLVFAKGVNFHCIFELSSISETSSIEPNCFIQTNLLPAYLIE